MVVNAPSSNIVSAAEHTIALLLAQARNIPQAHEDLKRGHWDRSKWQGVSSRARRSGSASGASARSSPSAASRSGCA